AEFHAGWIALRRLQYAQTALIHFSASSKAAVAANWRSRAAYWRGRAIEAGALGDTLDAFAEASALPLTFYGQLAIARRGDMSLAVPVVEANATQREALDSSMTGRVIDLLISANLVSFAQPLVIDLARTENDAGIIAAAAEAFISRDDAVTVSAMGRVAVERGLPLAQLSHPTFGIPAFKPLPGSGARDIVYAIAHQESAFRADAVSTADARGLMQMLPSTASRTAARFKVPFSPALLTAEPARSAMLGAAHVGELLEETRGALPLVFAAYNAGGGRVREWIAANGDPRRAEVDAVDWIEMIPIAETRHYVQKVMANLQVYRARFAGDHAALNLSEDLTSGRR
ncbi:MAG: lytic transglycosylase domain-containing protein, partial [Beijerinckiaceae bacterium]